MDDAERETQALQMHHKFSLRCQLLTQLHHPHNIPTFNREETILGSFVHRLFEFPSN